jgi:hypothetical protein
MYIWLLNPEAEQYLSLTCLVSARHFSAEVQTVGCVLVLHAMPSTATMRMLPASADHA